VIKHIVGQEIRLRLHFHTGSQLETYRALQPFGLTREHADAVFAGETYHRTQAQAWLNSRYQIEASEGHL
jgi:hypothetical protein